MSDELKEAADYYCLLYSSSSYTTEWNNTKYGLMYGPIELWDISQIDNVEGLFEDYSGNPNVTGWDVSGVTSFKNMFGSATSFNQDINSWDVSASTSFNEMFYEARSFNQNISSWDVSASTSFVSMFYYATSFNQDISSWDVSASRSFYGMFHYATSFNQDLCTWDIRHDADTNYFCDNGASCGNYSGKCSLEQTKNESNKNIHTSWYYLVFLIAYLLLL